ncbi:MAG: nucleotidyltransferase family protein [Putridiphycobacter sp.]
MINQNIIINSEEPLNQVLIQLNENPSLQTLIVVKDQKVVGTITDGDVRRGLIKGLDQSSKVSDFMFTNFTFLTKGIYDKTKLDFIKEKKLEIIPELNVDGTLHRIIDFRKVKTILPIDAVIMAGGIGSRLMPLTKDTPKPMLKIGNKPIMEYNVDLLKSYGISNLTLSVKYLKEIIQNYYKDGQHKEMKISYVTEDEPLGTIGAVKQVEVFSNDFILVMNSDLLTNINLEAMFNLLQTEQADMVMATTDYQVNIPYGVVELNGNNVNALREKPTYTYYSNAGIYIFKKSLIEIIPSHTFFNATDFLDKLIEQKKKVVHYPIKKYWLDIGKPIDFEKAQRDVDSITF